MKAFEDISVLFDDPLDEFSNINKLGLYVHGLLPGTIAQLYQKIVELLWNLKALISFL